VTSENPVTARNAVSPRISRLSWGRIEIDDRTPFKDAKLFPGGAREWDWNETGTRHEPGIQPSDVLELLEQGVHVVVLSQGMHRRLRVRPETLRLLEERGVSVHVLQTEEAAALYNQLAGKVPVGGLFHSTC
jgi:hypothetical protein